MRRMLRILRVAAAAGVLTATLAAQESDSFTRADIYQLKINGVSEQRILKLVAEKGINFEPTDQNLQALRQAGATQALLDGLRTARLNEHTANAKKLDSQGKHGDAEKEWRLGLALSPSAGALHQGLGESLLADDQLDEAIKELDIAAATEPGAEAKLQSAREHAQSRKSEVGRETEQKDREAERQRALQLQESERTREIHRTSGLSGTWADSDYRYMVYAVTLNSSDWQASWTKSGSGSVEFAGTLVGKIISGNRVRTFRDKACKKDVVLRGTMTAQVSDDGDSIVINYQDPNFKTTGLFGCGIQITGYNPMAMTLVRVR